MLYQSLPMTSHWLCKDRRYTCPHISLSAMSGAWMPAISPDFVVDRLYSARLAIYFHRLLTRLDD